ncbi:MAG: hypothetical protein IT370_31210 [Deltaproteobacteria bacterium]|nr:hypothetical protein [Deltaproteobacteria bacterium]
MGAAELVFVLLSLTTFGVQPNPNAPPAAEVLRYAPDDSDVMVHLDVEPMLANNWAKVQGLANHPAFKANPEVQNAVRQGIAQVEQMRMMAKATSGVDFINDMKSVTVFVPSLLREGEFLVSFRGSFPPDLLDRVASKMGAPTAKSNGKTTMPTPDGKLLAQVEAGTLLMGPSGLVKARTGVWKPRAPRGATRVTGFFDKEKPFFLLAMSPSAATRKVLLAKGRRDQGTDAMMHRDLLTGLDYGAFWLKSNGVGWTVTTKTPAGLQRAADFSEGVVSFMRANHHVARGMARLALAALPSLGKQGAMVTRFRPEILKLIEAWTGDGNFPATVATNAATRTVLVSATGKSLSDVLPVAGMVPLGAVFLLASKGSPSSMPMHGPASTGPMRPSTGTARPRNP